MIWSPFVRLYQCQFQRPMAVSYVPDHYKRLYDAARTSYERGLEAFQLGNTIMDVIRAMEKPIQSAGFVSITPYFHGIGLSLERPVAYSPVPARPQQRGKRRPMEGIPGGNGKNRGSAGTDPGFRTECGHPGPEAGGPFW